MAMTKAQMESDWRQYHQLLTAANQCIAECRFSDALVLAVRSFSVVDGMMQYGRKYEGRTFRNIETIDIVLLYAPALFDVDSLSALETLLKSQKRIDKNATDDIGGNVALAQEVMWRAHRVWDYLEVHGESEVGEAHREWNADHESFVTLIEIWERMGVVQRAPRDGRTQIAIVTRLSAVAAAKCSLCGVSVRGPKYKFLEHHACPKCRQVAPFVLLS